MISKKLSLVCIAISVASLAACYDGKGVTYYSPRTAIPENWKEQQKADAASKEAAIAEVKIDPKQVKLMKDMEEARAAKLKPVADWWKTLDDETLNELIAKLSESNLDFKIAEERIRQARTIYKESESDFFPSLDLSAGAGRTGTSKNSYSSSGKNFDAYSTGLDSSWEIDLFGKIRNQSKAARADLEMYEESMKNVMVSVVAEIATNYVELRVNQERLAIARQIMETQYKTFEIVSSQNDTGLVDESAKLQTKMQLENARASIPQLRTNIETAKNRIAVLLGKNVEELEFYFNQKNNVPETSIKVAVGIPADMLRTRPDVMMAEKKLVAESARVKSARADLYPSLKLNGSIGLEALKTGNLFNYASNVFSIASIIDWNIFDAGKLKQQLEYQKSVKRESALEYEQTVLEALEEVENNISSFTNEKIREHNLKEAHDAADKTLEIAKSQYTNGTINFNSYLASQVAELGAKDTLVASSGAAAIDMIKLYKSLGGGWESFWQADAINKK